MDSTFKYILCRLCLCESASLMDIFEETYEQGFVISEVIEDLLHFKVMKLRGLPWLVCTRCLEKLKEFRLFKMQCIDSKVAFESRFLVDGKHAINDQVEIRRVRKEDLEPDHDRVSYPQVEVSRVKIEKGETEIDQEFYPQVILETVEEGEVEDCMGAINTVLPKVMRSEDSLYVKGGFQSSVVQRVQGGLNCGPMPPDKHYHCSSCGKSFVKSSHLTRHIRTHTNDRPYACELCGKRYIENSDLTSHMMSHTGEKPFSCPHCGKGFYRNSHLNRHINTHRTSKARAQAVLLDAAEILSGGGVKTEDLRLDGDEEPLVSSLRENLERYEAKGLHFMGSLLEGRGCPPYPGTNRLDQQRLSWLRDGRSLLHPNGGSVEVKQEPLDMSSHEQSLECSMGDDGSEGIIGVGGLRDDEENKTFLCSFCGKGFSKNSQLLRHTRTHTDDRPFVCETCGRRYIEASDLNQHIKVHSGVKPHRCGQCGKGFMKNSHLKRHRITHTNERPYTCKVCRKGFIESSDLNRHMVVHSKDGTVGMGVDGHSGGGGGGREYGCNLCGKAFSFKSNLVTHMRTHSGSKPFVCEHCGKGFAQNGNLITHRRVHTGERPYVCRLCNKGFSQKSTLNHHIKTH